jgi:UDPglucose 6-dehydrogenase
MDAVGADKRIGRSFLNAGRGYGGGCFPKDVSGLISSSLQHGVDMPIMLAATEVNTSMPDYIAEKAGKVLGGLDGKKVAVLGLAFKAGTSDARKSPGISLANILQGNGAKVTAFDPQANGEAGDMLKQGINIAESSVDAVSGATAVFIATDWAEFKIMDFKLLADSMEGNLLVDCMNCLDASAVTDAGLRYVGVGRS